MGATKKCKSKCIVYESRRISNRLWDGEHPLAWGRAGMRGLAATVVALKGADAPDVRDALLNLKELEDKLKPGSEPSCDKCLAKLHLLSSIIAAPVFPDVALHHRQQATMLARRSHPRRPRDPEDTENRGFYICDLRAEISGVIAFMAKHPEEAG